MQFDKNRKTVTAAVVSIGIICLSVLWWQQRRQPQNASRNQEDEKMDEKTKNAIVFNRKRANELAEKPISTKPEDGRPSGEVLQKADKKDPPKDNSAGGQIVDDKSMLKKDENFDPKDIPDFTIELDDSDNDMF